MISVILELKGKKLTHFLESTGYIDLPHILMFVNVVVKRPSD